MKKRSLCVLLAVMMVTVLSSSVLAASKLPSLSESKYIQTYALKSSGKIYGYKDESLKTKSTQWISAADDECRIIKISTNGKAVYISYPLDKGGRSKAWFSRSEFSASNLTGSYDYKTFRQKVTTYRRSDGKQAYGYAAVNDQVYILGRSGSYTQILYPLSGGRWKLGWAKTSDVNAAVKQPESQLKLTGASQPGTITQGSGFTVKGVISSNYSITSVTVGIYDSSGKTVSEKTVSPNSTSYDINKIDSDIHFGQAKAGTNYYRIWASDQMAGKRQLLNVAFTVKPKPAPVILTDAAIQSAAETYSLSKNSNAYSALRSINNYASKLTSAERSGILVFLFEGVGSNSSKNARMNAMCVVVKSGKVCYVNRNSSTIPDYPFNPKKNGGDAMPTICSGVYSFTTTNHKGSYAALNVANAKVVRFSKQNDGYLSTSPSINVHRRSTDSIASASASWVNSAGCQLVGKAGTGASGEYAKFIKAVGIVGSSATGASKYSSYKTGKIIIDRSFARSYLQSIGYTNNAIEKIG